MKKFLLLVTFASNLCLAQTTYYSKQYGMPQGSATQSGNTTYYNNQYGMPQGSATSIGPTTIQPIRPYGR